MSTGAKSQANPAFAAKLPGRYRIVRRIATGGMASVWCAEDRVLDRNVAIKVLSERFAADELAIRRFKREARAAARVSAHPNVVTIFDVGDIEPDERGVAPSAFIVMELLPGGTVADAIQANTVTRAQTRRWLREAASALDHAHERGVVHRDIKPANFLLDQNGGLHVADFGIARLASEDTITSTGELFGTAAYLAPEQALGRDATGASDRYALAVAAFELLTGGRPFTAPHFAAQARQHIEDDPPRASERDGSLPRAVDDVLSRGMAKEPTDRYPTALAFVEALQSAQGGDDAGVTAPIDDPQTAATRELGDMGTAVAPVAAGAAAGVLGAGALGASQAGPHAPRRARPRPTTPARPPLTSPLRPGPSRREPLRGRAAALLALAAVALGIIVLISQLSNGSSPKRSAGRTHHSATRAKHHGAVAGHTSSSTTASGSSTASSSSSAATSPNDPAALQLLGHQELVDRNYPAAIATERRALASASRGSLTYAYALYDLGDALLLSGNPQAAIPILRQRLQIPNQTAVVQQTLNQALAAAGQAPQPPGPSGHHHDHGKGNGNGKGD